MRAPWDEFLAGSGPAGHAAQIYADERELVEPVAAFLAAGFAAGQPALVVATPEHWRLFAIALAQRDWEPEALEAHGLLLRADAAETLVAVCEDGVPSAARFAGVVGSLVDRLAAKRPRRVRVFGEMVDLLCERGRPNEALALEELWNDLAATRDFALLCAYRLDVFDKRAQLSLVPAICHAHSHLRPTDDADRFALAVDAALDDVLGSVQAGRVYALVAPHLHDAPVPVAQLALMWVTAHMPTLADRILELARANYLRTQPA